MSIPEYAARRATADHLTESKRWKVLRLENQKFPLIAYIPSDRKNDEVLSIYIEGDGLAWISSSLPSADPTPITPVGLQLALEHPAGNAAYLARPCQYIDVANQPCPSKFWLEARFSAEVIEASTHAIDRLKDAFGAKKIILVGYSGGGSVATLVAQRRRDVIELITVVGNLDHHSWTQHHRITPLLESLNPIDFALNSSGIEQIHFVGGKDSNILPRFVESYIARSRNKKPSRIVNIREFDHQCCWARDWTKIWRNEVDKGSSH